MLSNTFFSTKKRIAALGAAGVLFILVGLFVMWAYLPVFSSGKPVEFDLPAGGSVKTVVKALNDKDVSINETCFSLLARIKGVSGKLKAGSYELKRGESPADLLNKMSRGIFAMESLTFIEGTTFADMRRAINSHPELRHETLHMSDAKLLEKLGMSAKHGEGLFKPDTYLFKKGESDLKIYQLARDSHEKRFKKLWDSRDASLPYKTPYQAMIMASIIEKETGKRSDRGKIAAVFINRLKKGMMLQTDPSVIYGMGDRYDGNIRKRDLLRDTPYNTYTRYGLPPTPICLFGNESLQAAFKPDDTNALYFVAKGDGSSHFSETLDEHNQAVKTYILNGRKKQKTE